MRLRANKIFTCAPTVGCFGLFSPCHRSQRKKPGKKSRIIHPVGGPQVERFGRLPLKFAQASLEVSKCHGTFILDGARVGIPVIHVFFLSYSFLENHQYVYIYLMLQVRWFDPHWTFLWCFFFDRNQCVGKESPGIDAVERRMFFYCHQVLLAIMLEIYLRVSISMREKRHKTAEKTD